MLWSTARAYHGAYVKMLFAQQANRRDVSEHPARASAIAAMEQELQQVVDSANAGATGGEQDTDESALFRDGQLMLEEAINSPSPGLRFKEILGTLLNVVGYNHTVEGTEAFWQAADRCIDFVRHYQPSKPVAFDVGAAQGLEYRTLCVWINLDVASAVARGTKMNSNYVLQTVIQDPFKDLQGLEWLNKANDAIFVCLAQAAALAYEIEGRAPRPGPEQERADQIWRAINSSTSPVNPSTISSRVICLIFRESQYKLGCQHPSNLTVSRRAVSNVNSMVMMTGSDNTRSNSWREGTRIYFHQVVCKRNLLYPAIRTSVDSCLSLISLLETSRRSVPPALALPLWMAAAAAISSQERHRFRSVIKGLGPSAAWKDTLQDLEKLWELTDANGDPQQWPQVRLFIHDVHAPRSYNAFTVGQARHHPATWIPIS